MMLKFLSSTSAVGVKILLAVGDSASREGKKRKKNIEVLAVLKSCNTANHVSTDNNFSEVVEWSACLAQKRAFRVRRLLAPPSMMHIYR